MEKRRSNSLHGHVLHEALGRERPWLQSEKLPNYRDFFVGDDLLLQISNNTNHLICGRRGTGKTHLLGAFVELVNSEQSSNSMAIMLSALEFNLTPPSLVDESLEFSRAKYSRMLYQEFLSVLVDKLTCEIERRIKRGGFSKEVVGKIETTLLNLMYEVEHGSARFNNHKVKSKREESKNVDRSLNAGARAHLSLLSGIGLRASVEAKSDTASKSAETLIEEVDAECSTRLCQVRRLFGELVDLVRVCPIYLLIDEWMELDKNLNLGIQPYFAQLLKSTFFNDRRFSVKIASVWQQTDLYDRGNLDKSKGVELGDDIALGADLDTAFLRTEEEILDFFRSMLFKRLVFQVPRLDAYLREGSVDNELLVELFDNVENFKSLIAASHGIPRRFWHLFNKCAARIRYRFANHAISKTMIQDVARETYLVEKRKTLQDGSASQRLWSKINQYMDRSGSRWFVVSNAQALTSVALRKLIDEELIHQMPSAITPRQIRDSHKVLHIDYGNYIDWVQSNRIALDKVLDDAILPSFGDELDLSESLIDVSEFDPSCLACGKCRHRFEASAPIYVKFGVCPSCAEVPRQSRMVV